MFSFLKSKLGIGKHLEIIDEINYQKKLRYDLEKLKPLPGDDVAIILYNANNKQISSNIEALSKSLDMLSDKRDKFLPHHQIKEMFEEPYPVESKSIIYYIDSNIDNYKMLNRSILEPYIHSDLVEIHKYINFMKDSRFNKKFRKLYSSRIRQKLVNILEIYDYGAEEYVDHHIELDFYNELTTIKSLELIVTMVEFHRVINSLAHKQGITDKLILELDEIKDKMLVKFVQHCTNFDATVLIKKAKGLDGV